MSAPRQVGGGVLRARAGGGPCGGGRPWAGWPFSGALDVVLFTCAYGGAAGFWVGRRSVERAWARRQRRPALLVLSGGSPRVLLQALYRPERTVALRGLRGFRRLAAEKIEGCDGLVLVTGTGIACRAPLDA